MLDFKIMDTALKIAWIKRLTEHDDTAWKIIPEFAVTNNNNNNNNYYYYYYLLLIRRKYLCEYIQMRLTSYIKIIIK